MLRAGLAYVQFPIVEMAAPESLESTQSLVRRPWRGVHLALGLG